LVSSPTSERASNAPTTPTPPTLALASARLATLELRSTAPTLDVISANLVSTLVMLVAASFALPAPSPTSLELLFARSASAVTRPTLLVPTALLALLALSLSMEPARCAPTTLTLSLMELAPVLLATPDLK
jgi:hypothetical protein